ncbi:MAG: glycosyltransferase [Anaerolineales bacterium]|nr:glycosyltransferase [Anaerolineales bacterium]MDW8276983.1 glycosyltransferase family 2 protein [Anaerolineales bacterium]
MVNKASVSSFLPSISIVIPSLNSGAFIEETIQSLVNQKYPHLEIIVYDGNSTDATISILRKWEHAITWVSESDKGQSEAINKGLVRSHGEILGYLNADDFLLPGSLYKIGLTFAQTSKSIWWITGQCQIFNAKGQRIRLLIEKYKNFFLRYFPNINFLYLTNFISQPATFWKRSVWEKIGGLDETFHYAMDYDYWIRIWKRFGRPHIIHQPLAGFRVHPTSKTSLQGHQKAYVEEEEMILQSHDVSFTIRILHRIHRLGMTLVYRTINEHKIALLQR